MRTYITTLMLVATLGLVSCGGGNDVASSGATAVSAAAPASNASPASAPSTAATEPKVNGQIDERTGVAPVVAMTIWSPANCLISYYSLNPMQQNACDIAANNSTTSQQCAALGGSFFSPYYNTYSVYFCFYCYAYSCNYYSNEDFSGLPN
jgi:hypothetical protein